MLPEELRNYPWPDCYHRCDVVDELGVSECENISICSKKFPKTSKISFNIDDKNIYTSPGLTINNKIKLTIKSNSVSECYEVYLKFNDKKEYFLECISKEWLNYYKKENTILDIYIDHENHDYFKTKLIFDLGIFNNECYEINNANVKIDYSELRDFINLNMEVLYEDQYEDENQETY